MELSVPQRARPTACFVSLKYSAGFFVLRAQFRDVKSRLAEPNKAMPRFLF
jgi:hypothetical protein